MNVIACENKWCVHYQNQQCKYETIKINSYGMCEICVMIDPDETELKMSRKRYVDSKEVFW